MWPTMTSSSTTLEKPTMSDTVAMILCCLVFAGWGVLLALGV